MPDHRNFFGNLSGLCHAAVPALLYTALSSIVYSLAGYSGLKLSGLMRQAAALGVCLLVFAVPAVKELPVFGGRRGGIFRFPASFCYTAAVVTVSVVCNHLIRMTDMTQSSSGYRRVAEVFYGNSLALEIITLCVLGPLTEELVYRGFVYQRLWKCIGSLQAAVLSSLLFGVLHLNLVQGVYAFVLGLFLAYIVYKTGSLLTAAAAHMAANLASVLWTETDWLDFLNQDGTARYLLIALCLALSAIFFSYGNQLSKRY